MTTPGPKRSLMSRTRTRRNVASQTPTMQNLASHAQTRRNIVSCTDETESCVSDTNETESGISHRQDGILCLRQNYLSRNGFISHGRVSESVRLCERDYLSACVLSAV
jgi:hypothetical protein